MTPGRFGEICWVDGCMGNGYVVGSNLDTKLYVSPSEMDVQESSTNNILLMPEIIDPISEVDFVAESNANSSKVSSSTTLMAKHLETNSSSEMDLQESNTNNNIFMPEIIDPISEVDFVAESNANSSKVASSTTLMAKHLETSDIEINLAIKNFPNDPAYIPENVPYSQLLLFTQLGPCQPLPSELIDKKYPITTNTKTEKVRSFHNVYYYKKLKNQPPCKRSWLSYSPALNKLFCVTCKMFGLPKAKRLLIASQGTNKWSNIKRNIEQHELLPEHLQSEMSKALCNEINMCFGLFD
ncbi:hypothetical protein AGLY_014050 [Aphis glycines]|uniref:TTF-type domain-containing protein n=1 Tax=Aphis glycines TaxID=307491 RepID=A0A6G0T4J3_APHGL|nr:hypothetical protein AGLY_014050 [Aphis glycines]